MKNWHWRNWFELVGLGFNILVLTITTGGGGCGFEQWGLVVVNFQMGLRGFEGSPVHVVLVRMGYGFFAGKLNWGLFYSKSDAKAIEQGGQAPFDTSSVDNMRRLVEHSGTPGHIYPMALLGHNIMPPPLEVEKEIGEKRFIAFHGVGLSVSPGISFSEISTACENPEEAKEAYTQALYNVVTEQYNVLKSAIHGKQGLEASMPSVSLSQPWN
uniref:Uncharacterized protein n=1 Tax=Fagus sylvatica TaxID=28930 RepID=A0A2N9FXY2_FAGSY